VKTISVVCRNLIIALAGTVCGTAILAAGPAAQAQQQQPGVLVPATALRKDADKDIVFVLKEQKAQRRAVTLGGSVGDQRQVLGGVAAGEAVIVDAPEGLKDGAAVAIAKP